jgi:formyl-CoA transferase
MVISVEGPDGAPMQMIGSPIKRSHPDALPTAPPLLGDATDQVLAELGYDAAAIAAMHAEGIA